METTEEMQDFINQAFNESEHCDFGDYKLKNIRKLSAEDLVTVYEIYKSNIVADNVEYTQDVQRMIAFYFEYIKGAYQMAVTWFSKLADKGDAEAMYSLACLYSDTYYGLKPDYPKALELLKQSADKGDIDAMSYVAELYRGHFVERFGVEENLPMAVEWYKRSFLQNGNRQAAVCLAHSYRDGCGIEKNLDKYNLLMKYADRKEGVFDKDEARLIVADNDEERVAYCKENEIQPSAILAN